jgi:hypothetical protein
LLSLTQEKGRVLVYRTALECAVDEDLRGEWYRDALAFALARPGWRHVCCSALDTHVDGSTTTGATDASNTHSSSPEVKDAGSAR